MDSILKDLAYPKLLTTKADVSVQPFTRLRDDNALLLPPMDASTGTAQRRRLNLGGRRRPRSTADVDVTSAVHPFSDYPLSDSRDPGRAGLFPVNLSRRSNSTRSASNRGHGHLQVQPFTEDRPPDSYLTLIPTSTEYKIGKQIISEPLVGVVQLKGHLALLNAFSVLRDDVEAAEIEPFLSSPAQDVNDVKWRWFVGFAVERFDIWCRALRTETIVEGDEKCLPPIDVLMVWHAYMLNPRWYAEDSVRISACKELRMLEINFISSILDEQVVLEKEPSDARMENWRSLTSLPFDPVKGIHVLNTRIVKCPCCRTSNAVDLANQSGTGYLQDNFWATCSNTTCAARDITKSTLAHRKLAWDLAASATINSPESHLAGSVFPKSSKNRTGERIQSQICAEASADHVLIQTQIITQPIVSTGSSTTPPPDATLLLHAKDDDVFQSDREARCKTIMHYKRSMEALSARVGSMKDGNISQKIVKRILSAYRDDKLYSVDLVDAVLRQSTFIKQISALGWTRPDYFYQAGDELALHHALARYHAFLDLEVSSPNVGCVPTLDIDLVWHTHQLMPTKYYTDMGLYMEKFLDHDVTDAETFSAAFDRTSRAWHAKFNAPYTHCGCAAPARSVSGRLSRLMSLKWRKEGRMLVLPHSVSATHPSDHNVRDGQ